jgi:uncharacterized protein (TIGR02118 family)
MPLPAWISAKGLLRFLSAEHPLSRDDDMAVTDGPILKKVAFLVRKPGMSDGAFRSYWRDTHGPLVSTSPGYGAWRRQYVQSHVSGQGPIGGSFNYDGMASFVLPGTSPNEDSFSTTPIYQDRIRIDELNFIDMGKTVSMSAIEVTLKKGVGPVKLVALSAIRPELTGPEFQTRYRSYADAMLMAFGEQLAGWKANYVMKGTFRLPGGRMVSQMAVDCVEEFWFSDQATLQAVFNSDTYRTGVAIEADRLFVPEARSSFTARDYVFLEDGHPVIPDLS